MTEEKFEQAMLLFATTITGIGGVAQVQAKALEEISARLARIEAALGEALQAGRRALPPSERATSSN